nr:hypothetical protein [uncultured Clostridium sp.]
MKNAIQLKVLDLPSTETIFTELAKVEEETKEFREAILENDFENTIEEFHDVIQAMLSAYHLAGYDVKELIKGQEGHFEKLKNRGWKFKNE